eukprot:Platyproteum_vivax@DN6770_c0_g1_i1.p1
MHLDGNPCTEGYVFVFPNRLIENMWVQFQHIVKYVKRDQVPAPLPPVHDCNEDQMKVNFCTADQTVVMGGPFAFVVATLEGDADFQLISKEEVGEYFVVKWRRSLQKPFSSPLIMLRTATKPRSYDAQGFRAMGLDYHGHHVMETHMIRNRGELLKDEMLEQ